jgi:tyrosinase
VSKKIPLRVRRSLRALQDDYENGKKKPLETLMRAWKGIKELPPEDPNSLFMIGGYHGEPFRGAGWGNASYWGGYCNHGNILFPTWHRMYVLWIENALRSVPGCAGVTMPYWDETSPESLEGGIPWALTQKDFVLDGETIANPLRSFVLTGRRLQQAQGLRDRALSAVRPGRYRGRDRGDREAQRPVP